MNYSPAKSNDNNSTSSLRCKRWFSASIMMLGLVLMLSANAAHAQAAPTITTPASVSVTELQSFAIDVNATDDVDSEGNGLTYSKTGGQDQSRLNLNPNTGEVTFIDTPAVGLSHDFLHDDTFNLQVTVTDSSGLTAVQDLVINIIALPGPARTWHIENLVFDSGALASGSYKYDATSGTFGTFSDINVQITRNGVTNTYIATRPASGGNAVYLSFVTQASGDLTGTPVLGLELVSPMTNAGGKIGNRPGPQYLAYQGVCDTPNCAGVLPPYEEAFSGGHVIAGPRVWAIENLTFDTGATGSGFFRYDPDVGTNGTFSDLVVSIVKNANVTEYYFANGGAPGNSTQMSFVTANPATNSLTGLPSLVISLDSAMTGKGGSIDITPGSSSQGSCNNASCSNNVGPYDQANAGARITSVAGPRTWYIEGLHFDTGETATGSFTYNPDIGEHGGFSDINVTATQDGNTNNYVAVNPASSGNSTYLSFVTQQSGDLTGIPILVLTSASMAGNGPISILPGPQNLSYQGFCHASNCGPSDGPYDEANSGGRLTTVVAPPVITSAAAVSVAENQTSVIDMTATDNLDSEGNGLVYAITGGADQAAFSINSTTGVITFNNAPDFEAPGDVGGDNAYNLQVTLTDLGGLTAVQDLVITVTDVNEDTTPPTAIPTFDPAVNAAGWYNSDVTVTWNWVDGNGPNGELPSGIDPDNCALTSFLSGEGPMAIVGQCSDLAGNLGLQGSGSINIDKSAPSATPTFAPAANAAGWYNSSVTITWNWVDENSPNGAQLSGIDPDNCTLTSTLAGEGPQAIVGQCLDLAGNPGLLGSGSINIDQTAPETTMGSTPPATSTVDTATFEFGGTDAHSGVAGFECELNGMGNTTGFVACTSPHNVTGLADGSYAFSVRAIDFAGNTDVSAATHTWTVNTNTAPTLNAIGNQTIAEGQQLQFIISATDAEGGNLTFNVSNVPAGAALASNGDGTATFNWTPNSTQAGTYAGVLFTVSDNGQPALSASEAISIVVENTNIAPTLNAIGNQTATEGQPLQLTVSAADADGDNLSFSLSNAPTGASLADNGDGTATFSWTPSLTQAGTHTGVLFTVTDNGQPALNASEAISIVVGNTNTAPTLNAIGNQTAAEGQQLQLTVSATDTDGDNLTFSLSNAPTGASLVDNGDGTATFNWTPDFTQAGNYTNVLFSVSDNGQPTLADSETITITVGNINRPPQFDVIASQTSVEGAQLVFTVQANDADGDQLSLALANEPTGATFVDNNNGSGTFTWTPNFGQSGNYSVMFSATDNGLPVQTDTLDVMITVGNVNQPPVLDMIGARTVAEGDTLTFTLTANDPDGDSLTYALGNAPAGASLVDNGNGTAEFMWTPTFDQAGNFMDVLFTVTDNGSPQQADNESVTISVGDVNRPPVLNPIGNRTTQEGTTLTMTLTSSDADGHNVGFAQPVDLPTGATLFDNGDGTAVFDWTPGFDQAGNFPVTFVISDDGANAQSDMEVVMIIVGNVNRAPVLNAIGDQTATVGVALNITLISSDPDGDALSYVVPADLPANATVTDNNDGTAILSWTPAASQTGIAMVSIVVNDNGSPIESDAEVVAVTVSAAPVVTPTTPATPATPTIPANPATPPPTNPAIPATRSSGGGGSGSFGVIELLLGVFLLLLNKDS